MGRTSDSRPSTGLHPRCARATISEAEPAPKDVDLAPERAPVTCTLDMQPDWILSVSHPGSLSDGAMLLVDLSFSQVNLSLSKLAGRMVYFQSNWSVVTNDPWVLRNIVGYQFDIQRQPQQSYFPQMVVSKEQEPLVEAENLKLHLKGAIVPVWHHGTSCFASTLLL